MENQEIDKPFIVDGLRVPDKDGNTKGGYNGQLKISLGKPKREHATGPWKMEFKFVLSDHMYAKLFGQVITRIRDNFRSEPDTHNYQDIKKTVTAYSLEKLLERYNDMVDDYMWLVADESSPRKKTIFVKWSNVFASKKSHWNGAMMGVSASMTFNYFVGYTNGRRHFDLNYKPFNETYDVELYKEYIQIPWSEEREEFFYAVYLNFEQLKDKLESFFSSLTPETIDSHINNFKLLS